MLTSINRKFKKINFHIKLNRYKKKEKVNLPTFIQLEPTVRCNLNCITCSRSKVIETYKKLDLSLEDVDKILSFFPELKSIKLQGLGEPLLHPQIEEILKRFKEKNLRVWLISNGTLFNLEKFRTIILNYVSDIAISFDSVNKDNFNYLRKGADMDRIIQGLKSLIYERDKKSSELVIGINFVMSHKNYFELEELFDLIVNLRLDYASLTEVENWMIPGEKGFEESVKFAAEARSYAQSTKAIEKLRIKLLKKGIILGYKSSKKRLGECHWPFKSVFITVEGFVTPCCIRMHREHSLDNIFKINSFEGLWNSPKYQNFRRSHINRDLSNITCRNCPD